MTSEVKMPVEAIREALELACDLAGAELVRAQESFKGYPKEMQPAEADELIAAVGLASLDALLAQHAAAIEAARVEAEKLRADVLAVRAAGALLSNCAFNLAQRNPGQFTARDIMALDDARKRWDEVLRSLAKEAP